MTVWTIVLAAGSGSRFGGPKQFETLGDRRLVDWTVATARRVSDGVVVVLPDEHEWSGDDVDATVVGGATHTDSVRAGVNATPHHVDVIVLATAVHPLASAALSRAVIAAVRDGATAAVPGISSADAIKRAVDGRVVESVDKSELRIVQAPSAYRADSLRQVLASHHRAPEELELIERAGGNVAIVTGEVGNLHIATTDDLAMARAIVEARE